MASKTAPTQQHALADREAPQPAARTDRYSLAHLLPPPATNQSGLWQPIRSADGSPSRFAPFSLADGARGESKAVGGRGGRRGGGSARRSPAGGGGARPAMLITLCYLYLWARWGPCSAALIRRTVRRLHRSRCSFTFCCSAGPAAPPAHLPLRPAPPEERVCLRIGNKVFFTDETQVRAREGETRDGGLLRYRDPEGGASVRSPGCAALSSPVSGRASPVRLLLWKTACFSGL